MTTMADSAWLRDRAELKALVSAMPENMRAMLLLASCGLRFGELSELRRKDVDLPNRLIHVRRAVTRDGGGFTVAALHHDDARYPPHDITIPSELFPQIEDHLANYVELGSESLLFTARQGGHLAPSSFQTWFNPARHVIGRPWLRLNDLQFLDNGHNGHNNGQSEEPAPKHHKKKAWPSTNLALSPDELSALANAMPKNLQLLPLLATCAIGFGELAELRRKDVDLANGVIHIRRAVSVDRPKGKGAKTKGFVVNELGYTGHTRMRDVKIPSYLLAPIEAHLADYVAPDDDALLFRAKLHSGHIAQSSVTTHYHRARKIAGRPELRLQDLWHTGALLARDNGDAFTDLMAKSPPAPQKVRKTAGARKVMHNLAITINSFVFVIETTDPAEVDLENHREDIDEIFKGMASIGRFLSKVKEQKRD